MSGAPMVTLRGIGAAPGYAVGYAHVIDRDTRSVPVRHLTSHQVDQELARFDEAVEAAIAQLDAFLERLRTSPNEGTLILEAHRLILQDEMLLERTRDVIRDELLNAEAALERTLSTLEAAFENLDERYFRERGTDLRFAGSRVLAHLMGGHEMAPAAIESGAIIVAHELSPAQTLELSGLRISGFVTQVGGNASHTVIMARAMETPAVVGVAGVLDSVHHGQLLVVDGPGGVVIVDPDSETVAHYRELRESHLARQAALLEDRGVPADTLDGVRVTLEGNIEYVAEIESLLSHGGEGIGLFRTEYLFLRGGRAPDEETQVDEYRRILSEVAPRAATLRTVDLGADKLDETLGLDIDCDNPALGLRGVRLTLRQRGLLKTQLRALLRASVFGSLRLLVPFVSGVGEMRQVKEVLEEARAELAREGHAVAEHIPLGVMIELPSAAIVADLLAAEVDFFSLGTNDLVQYTLAVDRDNKAVAHLYRPLHPAVLRLVRGTVAAAEAAGIDVSICGEMAGEPFHTPLLIGCGLRVLSMNPVSVPAVKNVVRRCRADACLALVQELLTLPTAGDIVARLRAFHAEHLADA